jgi:hypothetical protein
LVGVREWEAAADKLGGAVVDARHLPFIRRTGVGRRADPKEVLA